MKSEILTADLSQPRHALAAKSLSAFYSFEKKRLEIETRLFLEELEKTFDPPKRLELRQALNENEKEKEQLELGWQNSSLRRKLTPDMSSVQSNATTIEKRIANTASIPSGGVLNRASSDAPGKRKLTGYSAEFGKLSEDLGGFREKLAIGCFADALKRSDVRFLFNHNPDNIFGRTASGTLQLSVDRIGLLFICDLPQFDAISTAIFHRVRRGDISGCSFAFTVERDRWEFSSGLDLRVIEKVARLFDVGPVTYPAYPETSISAITEDPPSIAEANRFFDESEFSDERSRETARKYRKAGRIIARNKCVTT